MLLNLISLQLFISYFKVKKKAVEKRKADESFGKEFAAMEAVSFRLLLVNWHIF